MLKLIFYKKWDEIRDFFNYSRMLRTRKARRKRLLARLYKPRLSALERSLKKKLYRKERLVSIEDFKTFVIY